MASKPKTRLNLKIDDNLKAWVVRYAQRKNTTVTALICAYFQALRLQEHSRKDEVVEQI